MFQDYFSWGVSGAFIGFCIGVVKSMAVGSTLFDFVAVTPRTIGDGVLSVDLAFLGFVFGVVCCAYSMVREADMDNEGSEEWVEIVQGNRTVRLYEADAETLAAIGNGYSRRRCVKEGISESRFNRATKELRKRGITGQFVVL